MARRATTQQAPEAPPAEQPQVEVQFAEATPEMLAEDAQITALRAEVQTLLDRFKDHRFPLQYESLGLLSERILLQALIDQGVLERRYVQQGVLTIQATLLRQRFQELCVKRDEVELTKISPRHRGQDKAARVGRQVMLNRAATRTER